VLTGAHHTPVSNHAWEKVKLKINLIYSELYT
jgi:hypothetical protein